MSTNPKEETMSHLERRAWAAREVGRQYKALLPQYPHVRIFISFDYSVMIDFGMGYVRRIEPRA
jgi:hypothetical protein